MFGMGFFEILMVGVVAILFLGPEKLPKALVDLAKLFRTLKKTLDETKESLEQEINLNKIKEEALAYKNSITQEAQNLTKELDLKTLDFKDSNQTQIKHIEMDSNSKNSTQQTKEVQFQEKHDTTLSFNTNCTTEPLNSQKESNA